MRGTNLEDGKQSSLAKVLRQPVTFWSPINSFLEIEEAWGMALPCYFKNPLAVVSCCCFFLQKPTKLKKTSNWEKKSGKVTAGHFLVRSISLLMQIFRPLNIKISLLHFRSINFLFAIQIVSRLTVPNFSLTCPQKKEKWHILSTPEVNQF